jgi:thiol-disulfide isomerase/thioredoxin
MRRTQKILELLRAYESPNVLATGANALAPMIWARAKGTTVWDADGKPKKLSDWRGRTVLVNLWATWCVPCRKEMPALESLQNRLGGPNFEVVAINIDTRDPEKPKKFFNDAHLTGLGYFTDQNAKVFQDLKAIGRALGMPTSVLVDGQGCEVATIAGPADWGSDDAIKLIQAAVKPVD